MPIAQVGDSDTIQNWFNDIPIVTKYLLVGTLISGAVTSFNIVDAYSQILVWDLVVKKFQIWRLITSCIFAGKFSFPFAMHTYILYLNSRNLEANPFNTGAGGNSADYLFFVLLSVGALLIVSFVFEMPVMSEAFLFVVIYNWSRKEPNAQMSMFGVKFKAIYLPWVYVAIRLIMGQSIMHPLIGIGIGHLYYFAVEILPLSHGYHLLKTPLVCTQAVSFLSGVSSNRQPTSTVNSQPQFPAPGANETPNLRHRRQPDQPNSYNWGQGRTLGSQ